MRFEKQYLTNRPYCYAALELNAGAEDLWIFAPAKKLGHKLPWL